MKGRYAIRRSADNNVQCYALHDGDMGGDTRLISERQDLLNHSPEGFEFGYRGSGPAQLALAILADHVGDDDAVSFHQQFKDVFIATVKEEKHAFDIIAADIDLWLAGIKEGGV